MCRQKSDSYHKLLCSLPSRKSNEVGPYDGSALLGLCCLCRCGKMDRHAKQPSAYDYRSLFIEEDAPVWRAYVYQSIILPWITTSGSLSESARFMMSFRLFGASSELFALSSLDSL